MSNSRIFSPELTASAFIIDDVIFGMCDDLIRESICDDPIRLMYEIRILLEQNISIPLMAYECISGQLAHAGLDSRTTKAWSLELLRAAGVSEADIDMIMNNPRAQEFLASSNTENAFAKFEINENDISWMLGNYYSPDVASGLCEHMAYAATRNAELGDSVFDSLGIYDPRLISNLRSYLGEIINTNVIETQGKGTFKRVLGRLSSVALRGLRPESLAPNSFKRRMGS